MNLVSIPNEAERRRRPRVPVELNIEALDNGPDLLAHDIGIGGMLVSTMHPRWPGQHIRVRFNLPTGGRAIRATCRVLDLVEVPKGIGLSLQFLALAPKAQLEILRFVNMRLKGQTKEQPQLH
ncbi:MAG: PilZ domain-containing protein [Deltaproteobacteria bacterium]|nr:PilZ domain-containing protein [Deltaproteobacteria bacterium]